MTPDRETLLPAIARLSIAEALGIAMPGVDLPEQAEWLHEPGACFVTLTKDGRLRGCIGSIEAHRPLLEDIRINARAAALRDPRSPPLSRDEFEQIRIEISLLTKPVPLPADNEASAIAMLSPGRDGVLLEYGNHRSTFLPQVWEQLPDPRDFLAHLKVKAGLASDFWHPKLLLSLYRVKKFTEKNRPLPGGPETEQ